MSSANGARIPSTTTRKVAMFITTLDMLAVIIALVVSITLVVTTALANARLTRSRDEYRSAYLDLKRQANSPISDFDVQA
jgi:hypothetical protein